MLHLQVTCEIHNPCQKVYCAFLNLSRLLPLRGRARSKTQVSHSSAESEITSLEAGLRMDGLPALQCWECVLEASSSEPAEGNLECHKRERVIQSNSHSDTCVFDSIDHVPRNIPNSSHSNQLFLFKVYTHSPVARTFFWCTYTARTLRTFLCVSHTCMAQGCLQCACRHLSVISPSPFSCFTSPCYCCSLTVTSRPFPTSTTSLTFLSTRSCRTSWT